MNGDNTSPASQPPWPRKILIVRLSAIGDVIHALPALRRLREAFPSSEIGWIVEDSAAAFVEGHPDLDRLHTIPKRRWRGAFLRRWFSEIRPFFREIRRIGYDVAIDFQGLTKSGAAAWLSAAAVRIGFGDRQGAELNKLFTNRKATPPPGAVHIVERNLALLRPLGVEGRPEAPRIFLPAEDREAARGILEGAKADGSKGRAALNVGAGWPTKRWPARNWAELARLLESALGIRSLLLWGNEEERACAEDAARIAAAPGMLEIAPPTTLRQSAALIEAMDLYVGGDTGLTHAAAALGTPTVGLYGASDAVRNAPYGPRAAALDARDMPCVPCWKRRCPSAGRAAPACLEAITPARVLEAARALIER